MWGGEEDCQSTRQTIHPLSTPLPEFGPGVYTKGGLLGGGELTCMYQVNLEWWGRLGIIFQSAEVYA